ncbi:MAG: hypothetical protein Fur0041_08320 [Bacteroidia bacterium]
MLYAVFKILFRITFQVFFRKVSFRNKTAIPDKGPLLICANHPGSFLDPIVIAALIRRNVFFLAKGEIFKSAFAKWFLPKINIVPVYRKQDNPELMHKNQETFQRCFEHLAKGGALIIFPEGLSVTDRNLRPLKTGAARIVLGAEELYHFSLDVKVVCIGLNYENPHAFRKDVVLSVSDPIHVQDYKEDYQLNGFQAVQRLTDDIKRNLEEQLIITGDLDTSRTVEQIERLYSRDALIEAGISPDDIDAEFELSKKIAGAVHYFRENSFEEYEQFRIALNSYFSKLNLLGLSDRVIRAKARHSLRWSSYIKELLFVITGFPLFVFGLLHNYIPFRTASWLSKNIVRQLEFRGAIGAAAGMFLFIFWYTGGIIFMHSFTEMQGIHWLYIFFWPVSGLFAWYYFLRLRFIGSKWYFMFIFSNRKEMISELISRRNQLFQMIREAGKRFEMSGKEMPQDSEGIL